MLKAITAGLIAFCAVYIFHDEGRRETIKQTMKNAYGYVCKRAEPLKQKLAAEKRSREIERCLPEFLRLTASCLRASLTVRQAVGECAMTLSGPLGEELRQADRELNSGITLESALGHMANRVRSRELNMAVTLLIAGSMYGGDIAGAFTSLAAITRKRLAAQREESVLTVQARYSSLILSALPVAFLLFFPGSDGSGLLSVLSRPSGWLIVACGLTLNCGGFIMMRRLTKSRRS